MSKKNIIIGLLILLALAGYIKKDFLIETTKDLIFGGQQYREDILTIALSSPETSLSPYSLNLDDLIRTSNIYQGLVSFDKNLRIVPALAVSWGNIDDRTWEFKLRKGVRFHDNSEFTSENIKKSYDEAKSEIPTILSSIEEIRIIDPYNIQIVTKNPDPLLLSKLTKFFISRPGNAGTGPYKIREWVKGETLDLTVFTDYWGEQPAYRNASYIVISSRTQRQKDFGEGKIGILTAVPQEDALELPKDQIKTSYSLEVNFLMFKMDDELLSQRSIREAIKSIFDPAKIESIGNNFVRQATQFVAPGVYGYDPSISPFKFDESRRAKDLFGDRMEKISLDYISGYRTLSEYLSKQLRDAGFSVKNNPITPEELIGKIKNNESRIFLAGWQAEDGDAGGFLNAFIRSDGEYNGGRYKNEEIDRMIEESNMEMDTQKRLTMLQNIMQKIDEELIGVPLFESSRLYAVKRGIIWEPRLDGLVLAAEVN